MAGRVDRIRMVAKLPRRAADAHKGDFGRVLVVGGSQGMIGAVAFACNAALRGGAGLVTFAAPAFAQPFIATLCPCATSQPLPCDDDGNVLAESAQQVVQMAGRADVLAVGPGMAVGAAQQTIVRAVLEQARPVVIDADGLNNLTHIDGWAAVRRCSLVLTPHPGEFSRLTGRATAEIQADRQTAVLDAMDAWTGQSPADVGPLVCVLKGAGTIVTDGRRMYVNDTGNPGMATGGSGDVLTGLLAAFIGQGLSPLDAACLAVRCHGRAGDIAAKELGEVSLTAADLLDYLPAAITEAVE